MQTIQDTKRYIERKIKKLNYIHTRLPEGYEQLNRDYRQLRDEVPILRNVISSLSSYEYGGSVMKNISHWANKISKTTSVASLKKDEIYTDISFVGKGLSHSITNQETQKVCNDFGVAFQKIANDKVRMNDELMKIDEELLRIKEKSKEVDKKRRLVNDSRYDAEELQQMNFFKEEDKERLLKIFNDNAGEAINSMKEFNDYKKLNDIIKNICMIYGKFCEKASKDLEIEDLKTEEE
ncbi:SWP12 [Hepatospora eriocheir]|uniref:SWP12 n=1 Tax=Hepatospora eriocheir TaxID=1081669 RepID=A0A1X0QBK5_9MICR|nr:SWP12 [Hepatospora eriocheir]